MDADAMREIAAADTKRGLVEIGDGAGDGAGENHAGGEGGDFNCEEDHADDQEEQDQCGAELADRSKEAPVERGRTKRKCGPNGSRGSFASRVEVHGIKD